MKFDFITVTDREELVKYKCDILDLFKNCFQNDLDPRLWDWAYIQNPVGDPIVSLCYCQNELIGHYAVIPSNTIMNNIEIKSLLSMTTMVHKNYRRHGIFVEQANIVYNEGRQQGYSLVYGFPNKNSAPGFKKRLNWTINANDYVALLTKKQLLSSKDLFEYSHNNNAIQFNTKNNESLNWRLNKPGCKYINNDGCIIKKYNDNFDLVFYDYNSLNHLQDNNKYYVLIDGEIHDLSDQKSFEYIFGYLPLNPTLSVNFKKDLILSDVF